MRKRQVRPAVDLKQKHGILNVKGALLQLHVTSRFDTVKWLVPLQSVSMQSDNCDNRADAKLYILAA